jgi:hypothetical protein
VRADGVAELDQRLFGLVSVIPDRRAEIEDRESGLAGKPDDLLGALQCPQIDEGGCTRSRGAWIRDVGAITPTPSGVR